ncbi:TonB-dependent receptor [Pontibacter sp. Tf4]|uniref:TonB-dependent receptor domain-containing protein n=1 Tax=Pontibacter sp. Tf4 TaxID=2761620 RepID=UPI0016241F25|nr:TonB-dependent receptor [Pontibacter sp. Tf4]MBB6611604.1 TonB-dependent receptor [Pontibacter sp. Tf4]
MEKRILPLLFYLCLCCGISALAQSSPTTAGTGKISGVLADSLTGKPVEFATIALLYGGTGNSAAVQMTSATGKFEFAGLQPGTYELAISFIGYRTKTVKQLQITTQKPAIVLGTVRFAPTATQLKEVTVQSLRPTITQEADKLVVSIEGTALAAGKTAYDVLATSPGVFVDPDGNIQLNGRAGATVMIDGKLTYLSARDLRSLLESMAAENIKNIEIITNPSAKYDAEGTSGILNINLKKNTIFGLNGSVAVGANYNGADVGYSTTGSINYKSGKWSSFLSLDMARRVFGREATFTRVFKDEGNTTYFDQVAESNGVVQGPPSVRVGSDYSLNDKHSIGFMSYYVTNKLHADFLTDTYIGSAPGNYNLFVEADNYNTNRFSNFTGNLHYAGKFDTLGTTLTADLDYVRITNRGFANFYNYSTVIGAGEPAKRDLLYTETPSGFDIYAAKLDFTKPLQNGQKLEMGLKASKVVSDADSRFFLNNGPVPVLDARRTNHFIYDETIYAAYANWNGKLRDNLTLQAGLRAEQTVSEGELVTTGEVDPRDYLSLFPSVFLQHKISDNYEINYNYSRRIQRPNYGHLNPFFSYRDQYTYWLGNPELRPQYTNSVGITQLFRKTYSLSLSYQHNQDVIAELVRIVPEDTTTIYYVGNVNDLRSIGLTALVPVKIMKNWDTNNTFVLSYNENSVIVEERQVINDQVYYMLQSNHTIALPRKFKLELNGTYYSKSVHALYIIEPRWWVNGGIRKSFLGDKLDVSLNVNDIFKSQRLVLGTKLDDGSVSDFDQYFRTRNATLTLRYNFSKGQKVEERRRNNLEELNRTGG